MSELRFEWDPDKAAEHVPKDGVSFEEAETIFSDEFATLIDDPDHSSDEGRFLLMGRSMKLRALVVAHCYRVADDVIRIISEREQLGRVVYLPAEAVGRWLDRRLVWRQQRNRVALGGCELDVAGVATVVAVYYGSDVTCLGPRVAVVPTANDTGCCIVRRPLTINRSSTKLSLAWRPPAALRGERSQPRGL